MFKNIYIGLFIFEDTCQEILPKVTIYYSKNWPTLDAPSPHTKWLPMRDIGFVMVSVKSWGDLSNPLGLILAPRC